jgi:hypothetical protein
MLQIATAEKREGERSNSANPHLRISSPLAGWQRKSLSPNDSHPRHESCPLAAPVRRSSPTLMRTPASRLTVNHPNDAFEQEANRVADRVMRMPDPAATAPQFSAAGASLQRKCSECEKEDEGEGKLQRKKAGAAPTVAPSLVHQVLSTPGQPLDRSTRAFMEPRFGHDFSHVRVHTDATAEKSATAVNALAYTVGNHVVFASGQYMPATATGQRLMAHELGHVMQQTQSPILPAEMSSAPSMVQRQDAGTQADAGGGATPDAGTATTTPDAGTTTPPDAGTGASGTGAPVAPPTGTPPAAPAARVLSVEVENQAEAITYPEASNLGAAGRSHWVTIAGRRPDVVVRANLDSAIPETDPAAAGVTWESEPGGALTPGTGPLHVTLSVPTARKRVVRARLGASQAELTLWAVFVQVSSAGPANPPTAARTATTLDVDANINLTGRIFPASIITDADRPSLDGANTVNPPGGTNVCGGALAGGVDHKWDMSRQRRLAVVDPAGLLPNMIATMNNGCVNNLSVYPATREEGNDDAGTGDENNDPYAHAGVITSTDDPTRPFPDAVGANGDTFEEHLQFKEFARLEFHRTWWTVSNFFPWRVHYRIQKVAGHWQDNGSDAGPDNAGF